MLELIDVHKVWDAAPHCAFTDLLAHGGFLYLACREGRSHISADGRLRILRRPLSIDDGEPGSWQSVALLRIEKRDLRDPTFSTTLDGRMMLLGGVAQRPRDNAPTEDGTGTMVSFSTNGSDWTRPKLVLDPGRWIWRAAWNQQGAFGFAYGGSKNVGPLDTVISLFRSDDGLSWKRHVNEALVEGCPSEVALQFARDGTAFALARRDGEPDSACLGHSQAPFLDWSWKDLNVHLGGPQLIALESQGPTRWIAAGRVIEGNRGYTEVLEIDTEQAELKTLLRLPSAGDNSYPGLVHHKHVLWISYYSSHEEKTCVYLARARFTDQPGAC